MPDGEQGKILERLNAQDGKLDELIEGQRSGYWYALTFFLVALGIAMFGIGATMPSTLADVAPRYIFSGFIILILGVLIVPIVWTVRRVARFLKRKEPKPRPSQKNQEGEIDLERLKHKVFLLEREKRRLDGYLDASWAIVKASPYFLISLGSIYLTTVIYGQEFQSTVLIAIGLIIAVVAVLLVAIRNLTHQITSVATELESSRKEVENRTNMARDDFRVVPTWVNPIGTSFDDIIFDVGGRWEGASLESRLDARRIEDMRHLNANLMDKIVEAITERNSYNGLNKDFVHYVGQILDIGKASRDWEKIGEEEINQSSHILKALYRACVRKSLQDTGTRLPDDIESKGEKEKLVYALLNGEESAGNQWPKLLAQNELVRIVAQMESLRRDQSMKAKIIDSDVEYFFGRKLIPIGP